MSFERNGIPFHPLTIDFARDLPGFETVLTKDFSGYGLTYLRQGSTPGGRLLVSMGGAAPILFSPGGTIQGTFQGLSFQRAGYAYGSAGGNSTVKPYAPRAGGVAQLLVSNNPGALYTEDPNLPPMFLPVPLIGNLQNGIPTGMKQVNLSVAPSAFTFVGGQNLNNAFYHPLQGFSKVRFYLYDASAAGNSYNVTPWVCPNTDTTKANQWFQLPNAQFTLANAVPAGSLSTAVITYSSYCQVVDVASLVEPVPSTAIGLNPTSLVFWQVDYVDGAGAPANVQIAVEGIA